MNKPSQAYGPWWQRLAWLLLIWAAGVGALGVVAYAMRWLMRAAGLAA